MKFHSNIILFSRTPSLRLLPLSIRIAIIGGLLALRIRGERLFWGMHLLGKIERNY